MPFLNASGSAAMGQADGPGSVDRRVVAAPGGGCCWFDDDRVLLQTKIGGQYALIVVRLSNGEVEPVEPTTGANPESIRAGGGRWLAWLAGTGMFGSLGLKPGAATIAAGPDGTLAWCPNQQSGTGLILSAPDGSAAGVPFAQVVDRDLQVLGPGVALWRDYGGGLRVVGRSPVRPALTPGRTRVATVAGEEWLVYWAEGYGLIAQVDGATDGYVLETRPVAFYHDARAVGGELVVAWSQTQGEGPGDLVKMTVDRSAPRRALKPTLPPVSFDIRHKAYVAVFKDPDGATGATAEIVVNQTGQIVRRPYFVASDSLGGPFVGECLGIYTEAQDPLGAGLIALAEQHQTRLVVCHDSQKPWVLPHGLRPFDIPMIEMYRYKVPAEETLAQAVSRWRRDADAMLATWPGDCAVCPPYYCMGGAKDSVPPAPPELWTEAEVLEMQTYLSEIVNRSSRIKVIAPFAYKRANGIEAHPPFKQSLDALLRAVPGLPSLLPVPGPKPPGPKPPTPTPEPPKPSGLFSVAIPNEVHMRAALRLGQYFASVDPGAVLKPDGFYHDAHGPGPFPGWYPVRFLKETRSDNPNAAFAISQPTPGDKRLMVRPEVVPGSMMSADATEFSGDIASEFGVRPNAADSEWGGYEAWNGWKLQGQGIDIVLVQYDRDGQKYTSACLTVVPL